MNGGIESMKHELKMTELDYLTEDWPGKSNTNLQSWVFG